ncbi:hypothetical protein PN498_28275 [Oscillatoria sp. CS-180]|nr:hypothetical protein [Oscillatoria sp. CS-180]
MFVLCLGWAECLIKRVSLPGLARNYGPLLRWVAECFRSTTVGVLPSASLLSSASSQCDRGWEIISSG